MTNKKKLALLGALALILTLVLIFWGLKSSNWRYFLATRTPKAAAIIITGSAIAFSSLIFQTVTHNRILTPSTLGLDSLYLLIQTIVIFLLGSSSIFIVNDNLNFLLTCGLMIVFSTFLFKSLLKNENGDLMKLLLVGIIFGTLFSSMTSFMQMMIDPNEFLHIQDKMFASFNSVNTKILTMSIVVIVLILIYCLRYLRIWDVMALGRQNAINLGVDYDRVVKQMLVIVSILVSVSTALVGPITFLGILVVNLAREFLKTYEHKYLIIGSSLLSVIALIGGQLIVERIFNFGTPISVIINFVGGIYFIYLLLKENVG